MATRAWSRISVVAWLGCTVTLQGCGSESSTPPAAGGSGGADASAGNGGSAGQGGGSGAGSDAGGAGGSAKGGAGGTAGGSGSDAGQSGASGQAGSGGAPIDSGPEPLPSGKVDVGSCKSLDAIQEQCSWTYQFDPAKCSTAKPCSKLVAFYAGGDQDCSKYGKILDAFAADGYVAACMAIFETSTGSGTEPYLLEAPRVDAVLKDFVTSAVAKVWNGQDLLVGGISHGATAPVIAMARTDLDDSAHWKGTNKTGGCFFDGIYDLAAIDELLGTGNSGSPCNLPVSHARMVGRYYTSDPLIHSCVNNKCACDPGHAPAMDQDTITSVPASAYAIKQWKLIECGSNMPVCTGDIVPAAPIQAVCATIEQAPDHTCTYESMPDDGHITCAGTGIDRCIQWFDGLPPG